MSHQAKAQAFIWGERSKYMALGLILNQTMQSTALNASKSSTHQAPGRLAMLAPPHLD